MEKHANEFLKTESLGRLMGKYSVPCIISLLVGALYNIVDQIFIANASYLGSSGNAANTVVFPLTVVALAIAVMMGDGCGAYVSVCLGAKDGANAGRSVGSAVTVTVCCSLVITAAYLIFQEPILTLFGARVNPQTFALSKEYFFYITLGIPFYMFGQTMTPIISADGSPRYSMAGMLTGSVVNVILDPIFIFIFKWGMMGAAVATVIGQVAVAAFALFYLRRMKAVKISRVFFRPCAQVLGKMLPLGATSFLSQISMVLSMAAVLNMLRKYGAVDPIFGQPAYAQIPTAVVGIVMKFYQIAISVVIGIAAGCIPVIGYNVGANMFDRVRGLLTRLLSVETIVGAAAFVIVQFFPRQLIGLFGAANESAYYANFAVRCFRIYLCMIIISCVDKAVTIYLQALGKAVASVSLSILREVVCGVGMPILLPLIWGLDGVLYFMAVSDVMTFTVTVFVIAKTYRYLKGRIAAAPCMVQGLRSCTARQEVQHALCQKRDSVMSSGPRLS